MIPNCRGCIEDMEAVELYEEDGLHFAGFGVGERKHLNICMVNDKGDVTVWVEFVTVNVTKRNNRKQREKV